MTNTGKKTTEERRALRRGLLEFVMLLDNVLPWQRFFNDHGVDLFTMFFKLTTYAPNVLYSVLNKNTDTLDVETHDVLCVTVLNHVKLIDSQINYVVNNILLKQMKAVEDKFQMLVYTAELMYSQDVKSTKRIGKVMALYSKLFRAVDAQEKDSHEKNKFLMGSLYALGGLLKIEAKSYLMTHNESENKPEGFKLVCPLSNPENPLDESEAKYLRKLKQDDLEFFSKEFFFVVR